LGRSTERATLAGKMPERVLIAMSGGVDSSVAAARLVAAGHDVVGVTLHLWDTPDDGSVRGRCCAPEDVHDARRVADLLGIPHFAFDRRALFEREVVSPFVDAYLEGETPSPCVRCNRGVKIGELFALADRLGAERVATGHYARLGKEGGSVRLQRGRDRDKDQSYFLHMLGPAALERLCFPLGEATKAEVRAEADRLALPGAGKGESQELCFVPTGRYDAFVASRAAGRARPGPIVDAEGQVIGAHDGIFRFTRGQRKKLGVALGKRAYVVDVDAGRAEVRLGDRERLLSHGALLADLSLHAGPLPLSCEAVVRYRGRPARAELFDGGELRFGEPVSTVVPGQYAVLYRGDTVLGGGVIRKALPEVRA
jgi:tRNA-uridine 2-sulfurtransferase